MTPINLSPFRKVHAILAQLDASPTLPTETFYELMIANEKASEEFFHMLTKMFAHQLGAAHVWIEMAAEEALHAWLLERALESLSPEQRAANIAPEIADRVRQGMAFLKGISPLDVIGQIHDLEDAYQAAHAQEYLEFCTVTDFVLSQDGIPDEILRAFLRSNLEKHPSHLQELENPDWRRFVPAHHFWKE